MQKPSERLNRARRRFEEIPELRIINDWNWDAVSETFYIQVSIDLGEDYEKIPQKTEWYISVEPSYPTGDIHVYPSVKNCITDTYPHQSNNSTISKNGLWRSGYLCVSHISLSLGRFALEKEPTSVDDRLYWNAARTVIWIRDAAQNKLVQEGDLFELPNFRYTSDSCKIFFYSEDTVSLIQ